LRGLWFGSPEPEDTNYQDAWDTKHSLAGWWRRIQVWNRELSPAQITEVEKNATRDHATTNTEQQDEAVAAYQDMLQDKLEGLPRDNSIDIDSTIVEEEVEDITDVVDDNDPVESVDDWLSE
jgi:hypothetical protein